ncbi:MAG TPA: DUF3617 family protein [Hyphomicrobiaceae bacterium]|nr:DUF3617 family protein [Hyphomicrobiaceae bacterium]
MIRLYARAAAVTSVTFLAVSAGAQTLDSLPQRRAGQWEMQTVTEKPAGAPVITTRICVDAATDHELMEFGLRTSKEVCSQHEVKRAGKSWVIDAQCTFGPMTSTTHTVVTGDFQSAVTLHIESKTTGLHGRADKFKETLMTQTSRWTGPCKDGMVPGDISMANGLKINVRQLKGLQKLLPKIQIR